VNAQLPDGKALSWRLLRLSYVVSFSVLPLVMLCIYTLLDLTAEQWRWFVGAVAVYTVLVGYPQGRFQLGILGVLPAYLDARRRGEVAPELRARAFADVIDLPRRSAVLGFAGWAVPVLVIAPIMDWHCRQWGVVDYASLVLPGLTAGLTAAIFLTFSVKRMVADVREALAQELPDPAARGALVRRTTIRTKLLASITGIALAPVLFAVLLFESEASRLQEAVTVRWQRELLDEVATRSAGADLQQALDQEEAGTRGRLGAVRLFALAPSGQPGADVPLDADALAQIRHDLEGGARSGDSLHLRSDQVFAWRRLDDGSSLVAAVPTADAVVGGRRLWTVMLLVLAGSAGVAVLLGHLLAEDVGRATERLREEAERLSSGDLRRGRVFESEDELGELSRTFEAMGESLRATVGRVVSAADRVEGTAAEMAEVAESVAGVTAAQVEGIQRTTSSMEAINTQVRGIADSSQALNVSVEESSSSILELGAAGEELNETASVLSERVNEVSTSIEQLVRSVKQVLESTESLAEAAVETSASMGEMATSMREVDASAEQTARLSEEVVSYAEVGQAKMVQTIEGMDAIREATETAERVIRSLGGRASEIGAIVDVIDDVADETNLLALNAAIIAAQAGEHGRAFSVVADEIRDLADRVLASTKEIGGLIRAVQGESENAIGAIEKGASSVAGGVDLTAEAGASLEEITRASRASGQRIAGIVAAVREQARAASHVVELMERVRGGVEEIRSAAVEQDRGNEVISRSSVAMRDVATQVRGTTEEQARGSGRIRESVEGVREAVERINSSLQEQSAACRSAVEFLEAMYARTRSNEQSASRLDQVAKSLVHQAQALRDDVQRFRL
jgi:methyl-accepting chemotaxis protein